MGYGWLIGFHMEYAGLGGVEEVGGAWGHVLNLEAWGQLWSWGREGSFGWTEDTLFDVLTDPLVINEKK